MIKQHCQQKFKLNIIETLISKASIDSNSSHNEFVVVNNMLKEYDNVREEVTNSNNK